MKKLNLCLVLIVSNFLFSENFNTTQQNDELTKKVFQAIWEEAMEAKYKVSQATPQLREELLENLCSSAPSTNFVTHADLSDSLTQAENTSASVFVSTDNQNTWIEKQFLLSDFIDFTDQIQFRFTASDLFNEGDTGSGASLVEGAIDDFKLEGVLYQSSLGDVNLDGNLDVLDVVLLVNNVLDEVFTANSDLNNDGAVNVLDVVTLVSTILGN